MALHTYTPTEYKNAPDHKTTPLNANNLNNSEDGIKNAYTDIKSIYDEIGDIIAHRQETLTADKAYSVGDEFIYEGKLYRATAAIANGGAITIGTNCTLAGSMTVQLLNMVYPVGSIYMSVNNTNPSALFGGTWIAWGSGKVPVGIDTGDTDFNTSEKTGGAKTVTLTSVQSGVPAHSHGMNNHTHSIPSLSGSTNETGEHSHEVARELRGFNTNGDQYFFAIPGTAYDVTRTKNDGKHTHTVTTNASTTGGASGTTENNTAANASQPHTNLQPYITCYMWKRTA